MILLRLFAGLLCVWLLVCSRVAHAQTKAPPDSTHIIATQNVPKTLKSIEIIEYKQHRTAQGATVIVIDSLWRNSGTIDGVLGTFANQFVRNYGVGTLALAAVRGTNAAQTAVLWQGVNLQSAMNGVADLALMPAYLFDNAKVVLGGGGSLYGSGAVGGTVLLHNNFAFVDTRFSAQIKPQMGSFGQRSLGTRLQYHHPKFYIDAKSYTSTAKNDFEYQTLELGLPTRTLTNAAAQQQAYTLSAGFRPNSYHFVELHTWQQRTHRQIPPTLTTATSRSHQADSTTRTAIVWQYSRRRTHTKTQVAHATETIFFADSNINLYAHNQAKTTLAETNITQNYKKISTLIGAQYTHIQAQAQAYQARQMQYQTAFFGQIDIKTSEKTNVSTAARHQNTQLKQRALTYTMSANYALNTKNNFKINAATSYRLPTFNDLYWKESSAVGNPNLLPESGKNIDVGYVFRDNKRQFHANFFVIDIKNNIVWLPNNQNIFMPRNLLRTLSTGTELKASYALKINKTNLKYTLQYHYTNATDASTKKQLIYTPKHQATTQLQGNYKQMHAQYSHQWVGARYTTSDNENTVKKHSIASLSINYTQKMATKCSINAQVEINNLYNTRYQILAYRIMPPRSLLASLTLNFN